MSRLDERQQQSSTFTAAIRRYLPDIVYGANDGLITTFAVVSGVTGAALSPRLVLIIGVANLFADGFSMGASNYLALRSHDHEEAVFESRRAARHGLATFIAFVAIGAIPLLSYLAPQEQSQRYPTALALTLGALFAVGAGRAAFIRRIWWRSGLEMLVLGSLASIVAYAVGAALARLGA